LSRNAQQGHRDGVEIRCRQTTVTLKELEDSGVLHHLPGKPHVERRQPDRLIVHHLHRGAAMAEKQHRSELGILHRPDDQLVGAGAVNHGLYRKTQQLRFGMGNGELLGHGLGTLPNRGGALEIKRHAPDVRLMGDVGTKHLERRRTSDPGGQRGCRRGGFGAAGLHHRHPIGGEHRLGFGLEEPRAPLFQCLVQNCAHPRRLGRKVLGLRRRCLHQRLSPTIVIHQIGEGLHGIARRVVGRETVLDEQPPALLGETIADPAREQRRAVIGAGRVDDRPGGLGCGGDGGGAVEHQYGVVDGIAARERARV